MNFQTINFKVINPNNKEVSSQLLHLLSLPSDNLRLVAYSVQQLPNLSREVYSVEILNNLINNKVDYLVVILNNHNSKQEVFSVEEVQLNHNSKLEVGYSEVEELNHSREVY